MTEETPHHERENSNQSRHTLGQNNTTHFLMGLAFPLPAWALLAFLLFAVRAKKRQEAT